MPFLTWSDCLSTHGSRDRCNPVVCPAQTAAASFAGPPPHPRWEPCRLANAAATLRPPEVDMVCHLGIVYLLSRYMWIIASYTGPRGPVVR